MQWYPWVGPAASERMLGGWQLPPHRLCQLLRASNCPLTDVTDPNSIRAAVGKVRERVGRAGLNLLINDSGATRRSTLATETAENMTLLYTTNTIGPLQTCQVSPRRLPGPRLLPGWGGRGWKHLPR